MKSLEIIAHPANKQELSVIKAFFKALKINFKMQKEESPYDPEFVEKVLQSENDIQQGKGITMTMDELDNLCK